LAEGAAPLRCYIGQVGEVDEHGIRVTLSDWVDGAASSWDFFAPWTSITSALVGTPARDTKGFGLAASKWQEQCTRLGQTLGTEGEG